MSKHSPGPWKLDPHNPRILDANGYVVASIKNNDRGRCDGHALAASLKMLAVLETVYEALPKGWGWGSTRIRPMVEAVITEARGECQ